MDELRFDGHRARILSPSNVEEMLVAIGEKEKDPEFVEILLSSELVVDLCLRLIRLEDEGRNDHE
jgi:hypothetical protein